MTLTKHSGLAILWILSAAAVVGCGGGNPPPGRHDAGGRTGSDASVGTDGGTPTDAGPVDAARVDGGGGPGVDGGVGPGVDGGVGPGVDGSVGPGVDGGVGPGVDANVPDGGTDAGTDGGFDAGPPTCTTLVCGANATCILTGGVASCACNTGYTGDGITCTDVNECSTGSPCGAGTCTNTPGSYTCTCPAGYTGTGSTMCTDVNECASGSPCGAGTCMNTGGSYMCTCPAGYTGTGTTMCTDVNECASGSPCGAGTCMNTAGSYMCTCPAGYTGTGTTMCTDVNECASGSPCGAGTCVNTAGSFMCTCPAGYTGTGTTMCTDVNECTSGSPCGAGTCMNTAGSYTCTCPAGYTGTGTTMCTDVNECTAGSPCGVHGTLCTNTVGSYTCTCAAGFTAPASGGTCTDLDECAAGTPCAPGSCTNTSGSFSCTCPAGYTGTGTTSCVDINECTAGTATCDVHATCANTVGSYTCTCVAGWAGSGMVCADVNECTNGTAVCAAGATCRNTVGTYGCECPFGTHGPGRTGVCTGARILLYDDNASTQATTAAADLGYPIVTATAATFDATFDAGGFDLIIVESSNSFIAATSTTRMENWLNAGGRMIFSYWSLNSAPATTRTALGLTAVTTWDAARSIFADNTSFPLFNGVQSVPTIATVNTFSDDGDELTTLAAGGVVEGHFDTVAGATALAVTRGGRAIVMGFLPDEVTGNADADALLDMRELYQNEIAYEMKPRVLIYSFTAASTLADEAATSLGMDVNLIAGNTAAFDTALTAGQYDLVIVDVAIGPSPSATNITNLVNYVNAGGRLIYGSWAFATGAATEGPLATALGITSAASFGAVRSAFRDTTCPTDLWGSRSPFPSPLTFADTAGTDGQAITVSAGSYLCGRFDSAVGAGALAVTNNEHVVFNGFEMSEANATNNDGDATPDSQELYVNEMLYVLRPRTLLFEDFTVLSNQNALNLLGRPYDRVTDAATFNTDFDRRRGEYDAILFDQEAVGIDGTNQTRLQNWTATNGRIVFDYWSLNSASAAFMNSLGIASVFTFSTNRTVFRDPAAAVNLFAVQQTVPSPIAGRDRLGDNGDELTILGGAGFAGTRFDTVAGPYATVVTHGNRVLVNGFLQGDMGAVMGEPFVPQDADADTVADMDEYIYNECIVAEGAQ